MKIRFEVHRTGLEVCGRGVRILDVGRNEAAATAMWATANCARVAGLRVSLEYDQRGLIRAVPASAPAEEP